jgi:hypothetical protein
MIAFGSIQDAGFRMQARDMSGPASCGSLPAGERPAKPAGRIPESLESGMPTRALESGRVAGATLSRARPAPTKNQASPLHPDSCILHRGRQTAVEAACR